MSTNKFYWIKLRTNFFSREDIDFLLSQKNGAEYVVLYQMLCLNTANNQGRLETKMGEIIIPYNAEKIVRDCKYFDIDTVNVAMSLYKRLGLIYEEEQDGVLRILDYEEMVGSESANHEAVKKRQQRLKKRQEDNLRDNTGTKCLTEYRDKSIEYRDKILDIDKEIELDNNTSLPAPTTPSKKDILLQYENEFEKLWEHYPNKKGKDQAKNKYLLARKQGITYETIAQGLKNYINYIKSGNIEEKFIKHGSTWFNQKCWNDDYKISNQNKTEKVDKQMEILKGVHNGSIKVD